MVSALPLPMPFLPSPSVSSFSPPSPTFCHIRPSRWVLYHEWMVDQVDDWYRVEDRSPCEVARLAGVFNTSSTLPASAQAQARRACVEATASPPLPLQRGSVPGAGVSAERVPPPALRGECHAKIGSCESMHVAALSGQHNKNRVVFIHVGLAAVAGAEAMRRMQALALTFGYADLNN